MSTALAPPSTESRRARTAVAALFLTNGALFANLVPRFPEIKADLALDNAAYGVAIAAFPAGAVVAGLAAAVVIRRLGSGRAAVLGTILTAIGTVLAGFSPSLLVFAGALAFAGATDAITDVAQNSHGLRVQRRYGRSIINSFHAIWSIGAVLGGSMAAGAIALGLPRAVHLSISGVLFAVVALTALRFLLRGRDDETAAEPGAARVVRARVRPRVVLLLAAMVAVAIAGTLVEDAASTWAAVYLGGSLGATAAVAAYGFVALVGAQFVGRILGDRLVDRFGQRTVLRIGGAIAALGMGAALAFPSVPGTIAGFAAAGFGLATTVPAAMHEADEIRGLRAGTGVTIVSWLMRLGFLLSPPIVGLVADGAGLRVGLLVVPIAGVVAVLLAGVLGRSRTAGAAS
ncbi:MULTISPECIES: MFS transporter [unclassified Rathayibacter]|uniref:MFS transporter n=1 Tax=unclassified Rathayibacter TaxID=2609250 RepID=UPI0010468668|nr:MULTISPECIES: MFS transporter [unclassified Rathayibacter]MCJ1702491.1 MFS transporter [Rathayibacter sp. VKM Ac-2926]TCL85671.1 putative MFS family arabinose efflux permease [Rathayibacter sp. PhB192]TCM31492.1 putative MFS family arabinose efflux permease [Rathayibacter sp. PhB179]